MIDGRAIGEMFLAFVVIALVVGVLLGVFIGWIWPHVVFHWPVTFK